MQTIENNAVRTQGDTHAEPLKFSKRIGSTVYLVSVHSSTTSHETVQDKIQRLIEREVRDSA